MCGCGGDPKPIVMTEPRLNPYLRTHVKVRVVKHTEDYSWLIGASGEKYSLRRIGSECRVLVDDYLAEPDRFELIESDFVESYRGKAMQCDLSVEWEDARHRRYRCIRCGEATSIVKKDVRMFVQCGRKGLGDRVSGILKRWFRECDACTDRRNRLNNLDRWIYRWIKGKQGANYQEKRIGPLPSPFTGWSWRNLWRRRSHVTGGPVPASTRQSERRQRVPVSANPLGIRRPPRPSPGRP